MSRLLHAWAVVSLVWIWSLSVGALGVQASDAYLGEWLLDFERSTGPQAVAGTVVRVVRDGTLVREAPGEAGVVVQRFPVNGAKQQLAPNIVGAASWVVMPWVARL